MRAERPRDTLTGSLHSVVEEIAHGDRLRPRLDAGAGGHEVAEGGGGSFRRHLHRRHGREAADDPAHHAARHAAFHAAGNPALDADARFRLQEPGRRDRRSGAPAGGRPAAEAPADVGRTAAASAG